MVTRVGRKLRSAKTKDDIRLPSPRQPLDPDKAIDVAKANFRKKREACTKLETELAAMKHEMEASREDLHRAMDMSSRLANAKRDLADAGQDRDAKRRKLVAAHALTKELEDQYSRAKTEEKERRQELDEARTRVSEAEMSLEETVSAMRELEEAGEDSS